MALKLVISESLDARTGDVMVGLCSREESAE